MVMVSGPVLTGPEAAAQGKQVISLSSQSLSSLQRSQTGWGISFWCKVLQCFSIRLCAGITPEA